MNGAKREYQRSSTLPAKRLKFIRCEEDSDHCDKEEEPHCSSTPRNVVAVPEESGVVLLKLGDGEPLKLFLRLAGPARSVGTELWGAGLVLAHRLLANREVCRGKAVLELGAGCGIAGLVAALCGGERVLLTDRADDFILTNLARGITANHLNTKVQAQSLDWEACGEEAPELWDVILGADLVYDSLSSLCHLLGVLRRRLAPEGRFYGASPTTRGLIPQLMRLAQGESVDPRLHAAAQGLWIRVRTAPPEMVRAAGEPPTQIPVSMRRVQAVGADLGVALPHRPALPRRLLVDADRPYCLWEAGLEK